MRIAALFAASVIAIGLSAAGGSSQAAELVPQLEKHQSLADEAGWRYQNYCWRWRNTCTDRWGWGTWRYRRCLGFHGCLPNLRLKQLR
jgi:hypothetical protein